MFYWNEAISMFHYDPLLFYGKLKWSKLRDMKRIRPNHYQGFIHPSPKSFQIWDYIIRKLNPKSVIDPFLGSGTTAEVCTKLGIPWIGYEINEVYSQDINKRLKNCKKEPQQINLEKYVREVSDSREDDDED